MRRLSQRLIHQADAHLHPLCKCAMTDLEFERDSRRTSAIVWQSDTSSICMFGYSLRPNLKTSVTLSKFISLSDIYLPQGFVCANVDLTVYSAQQGNLMWRRHSSDRPWNIKSLKPLADIDTLQITHWPKGALFRSWEGCIDHFCFFFIARGNYLVVTLSAWMAYSLKVSLEPLQPPPKRPPYSEACAGLPYLPHWRGPWDWSMSCSKRP